MTHLNGSTTINLNPFNYPNPIPPPATDTTYPNLESIEIYLFTHAARNGFDISIADTRKTHIQYKCSLGPHGHKKTTASTNTPTTTLPAVAKTCPYKVTARRSQTTHQWQVEIIEGTHDHPPHSKPPVVRQPPKSRQRPVEVPDEVSDSVKPQHQPPHPSQPSLQSQQTCPSTQYDALLTQMDSLPSDTRARLLKRFLHECEVVQDVLCNSGTLLENEDPTQHSKLKSLKPAKPSNTSKTTNPEQPSQQPNPESKPESNPNTNTHSHDDSEDEPFFITQSNDINPINSRSKSGHSNSNESVLNKSINQAGTSKHHTTQLTKEQTIFGPTTQPPYTVQSPHSIQQDLSLQIPQNQILRNQMQNETQLSQLPSPQPTQPTLKVVNINEELESQLHSPPRSDCSSTSHRAEELLIITSLTPRKKKQEPAVDFGMKQEVHQSAVQERYHPNQDPFTSENASSNGKKQAPISDKEPTPNTIADTAPTTDALELVLNSELTTTEQSTVLCNKENPIVNNIEPRVKSRKRKFDSNGPRQPTRTSARRKAAESQKDNAQLQTMNNEQSCTNPISATPTPEITSDKPSATGLVTRSSELIVSTAQKIRRVQKPNFLKHMSPEELKEEEEIEATVLEVAKPVLTTYKLSLN
ncbi:hypothetical protein DFH28DRAFT_1085489 [Melampsora americana]|nr:hypothetical protein DFH28DRAFT_1085489 [Melampsora americana]